jgi:hypothetical protein
MRLWYGYYFFLSPRRSTDINKLRHGKRVSVPREKVMQHRPCKKGDAKKVTDLFKQIDLSPF